MRAERRFHPDVWRIAFSAFCADLGYQMVVVGLPLYLVFTLGAPAWVYGLATALSYGPGALIAYVGGRAGDRIGHRKVALFGNCLIPLLSLTGLPGAVAPGIALFAGGWWARNFRSPSRRAMLAAVVAQQTRNRAFALLHALDVSGGMLAALALMGLIAAHLPLRWIFLLTLLPLGASTVFLAQAGRSGGETSPAARRHGAAGGRQRALYRGVILSAALYGFSSYSIGFPILTVAQGTRSLSLGALAFVVFTGVSALAGLLMGIPRRAGAPSLALLGYGVAAAGAVCLLLAYRAAAGPVPLYGAVAVLGVALGVIETLEPSLISKLTPPEAAGGGFGALTAARSVGLLLGNLSMGLLYGFSPVYAYGYAAAVALLAALVLLASVWMARRLAPQPD